MRRTPHFPNERGFAVLTLVLLPAFLVLAFGAFHLNTLVIQERELQTVCRDRLLAAQKSAALGIEALLALNPQVAGLNLEHELKKLQLEVALANMNPMAVLYASELALIIARQTALAGRQRVLFKMGRAQQSIELRRLRSELLVRVRKRQGRTATGTFEARFQVPPAKDWALIPQGSPFPEYHIPGNFPEQQALHVDWNWRFTPTEGVEKWIPWKTRKSLRCGATLIRKAGTFESRIHEDKSFSKSL